LNFVVQITDDELRDAATLAAQTLAVFARMPGHYSNTINSHLRGKLGEIACARWLTTNGVRVDPIFRDTSKIKDCDIIAARDTSLRLDVKTWDQTYWDEMGRCVAANQLSKLRAKADGILWCVSSPKLTSGVVVKLAGWSPIADIEISPRRMTGPKGRRQVDNFQVDNNKMRPLSELLAALDR